MKRWLSIFWVGTIVAIVGWNLFAYDQASIDRLLRTRQCPRCDLYRANLNRLDLSGANLREAKLAYATFREATLYGADLTGADLRGTVFDGAVWIDGTICQFGSSGICRQKEN
ncbi:pentapeptide repeat-containing protein [bacterium]|nr:pentapeptide repeat-containing protein [bacterium]